VIIVVAVVALVGVNIAGLLHWHGENAGFDAVTPNTPGEVNPQLSAYLTRFIDEVNARPNDFRRHAELGLVYEANLHWDEAAACFTNAISLAPNEPLPRLHLAIVQSQNGNADQAMETLRDLTRRNPDFVPAQHRLGTTALDRGELAVAEAAFVRVIALNPNAHEGYIGLADINVRRKDYEVAAQLLDKALSIKPDNGTAHHLLGLAYLGLHRDVEAQREMRLGSNAGAIEMSDSWSLKLPGHATGVPRLTTRAIALMNAGKLDEAAAVLIECLQYQPDNPDVLNNLSTVRSRQGRFDEVLMLLQRANEANPNHHQTYSNLATYYWRTNRAAQAIESMSKALALAPTDASYHRKIASILASERRFAEAREHRVEAAQYDPNNALNFAKLAELCKELGLLSEATEALARAKELAPSDPEIVSVANQFEAINPR